MTIRFLHKILNEIMTLNIQKSSRETHTTLKYTDSQTLTVTRRCWTVTCRGPCMPPTTVEAALEAFTGVTTRTVCVVTPAGLN